MSKLLLGWGEDAPRQGIGFTQRAGSPAASSALIEEGGDDHALFIAPTGAGKGRGIAIPNALTHDGSAIILDVKGEIAAVTARYREEELGHQIVRIDPWGISGPESDCFNPLDIIAAAGNTGMSDAALSLAASMGSESTYKDRFWGERAEVLIAAVFAHYASKSGADRAMGRAIHRLSGDDVVYRLAVLLDTESPMNPFSYGHIASFLGTTDVTRSGIQATFESYVRQFTSENIARITDWTSFRFTDIKKGAPVTVYLIVPPEALRSHAAFIRMTISAFLTLLMGRKTRPEKPTLVLVDEMGQLGTIDELVTIVTLLRGYGVRFMGFVQSYAQLRKAYPNDHETIFDNCGIVGTFGHTKLTQSEEMARVLGDLSADTLYNLGRDQLAVKRRGEKTEILRRLDYLNDSLFAGKFDPNPLHDRPEDWGSDPFDQIDAANDRIGERVEVRQSFTKERLERQEKSLKRLMDRLNFPGGTGSSSGGTSDGGLK